MKSFTLPLPVCFSCRTICFATAFFLLSLPGFSQLGWVQVPSPNPSATRNMIRGISGTSSSDVWAVGSYEEVFTYNPYNVQNDLILHWNGTGWQQFPAMHLSITLDDLWDVEAISANNVWAVGNYNDYATTRAELLHYNGTAWTNQALPFITGGSFLYALHAISANDIWAAGGKSGSPIRPPYVQHYDGSSWTEMTVPTVGSFRNYFNDIHGASNDIWAVGHWGNGYGDFRALVMHFNGSNWVNSPLPSNVTSQLGEVLSVKMVASNDVWAVGYYLTGYMFKIHWNGSAWTEITPTNGGGGAFAVLTGNNIYGVGGEISHWDGAGWTIVDPLSQLENPSLGSTVVFSNGEIWAGGRTVDAGSNFFSLIYRSVNNTPIFSGGAIQLWTVNANTNNNPAGSLLITTDADVSQQLTYTVVAAPLHGSVSGLPAIAITNNGTATPAGITYTPVAGFTGTDQFVMRVAAGTIHSETTINVNVLGPVPVILTDFNVTADGHKALLKWNTSSESNAEKFQAEQSPDGINFIPIGNVAAHGTSSMAHSYSFIHQSPGVGRDYYRLILFDLDGRTTIFPVRSVLFDEGMLKPVILVANPVDNGMIKIRLNARGIFRVNIYDLHGKSLVAKTINNTLAGSQYMIAIPGFKAGV
ncbi:MAG TPA: Ig-like domain-containing protein, partial [Ferruginibacter sp.]|nr:Ig-like domain-containing protein [Ferruginibacter sp.]